LIFADGKVTPDEHAFLRELSKEAKSVGSEFLLLLNQAGAK
jgi:hypothetical protein